MTKTSLLNRSCLSAASMAGLMLLAATSAQAQQRQFQIPAGDLRAALTAYEAATGQTITVDEADVAGRTTRGAQGSFSSREALDRILSGARLRSCPIAGGFAVVIDVQSCASGSSLPSGQATQVSDVIVTGTAVSHLADRSRTGTRMDADPMTLPLTVSTVSEELLAQQQAISLTDAVANVAGVSGDPDGSFRMRGFSAGVMRNGNLTADGTTGDVPLVAVSRVEVVKGPEAIIAGVASRYGGVVNVITKTPQAARVADFTTTLGSRGYYDIGMDVGGAVNDDKTVLVRLVASTQNTDHNLAGYDGPSSDYVAPSITLRRPSWGTEVTAQYEYQDSRKAPDLTVFAFGGELTDDLPIVRTGPRDDGSRTKSRIASLSLEQKINEDWSFALRYTQNKQDRDTATGLNFVGTDFGLPFPSIFTIASLSDSRATINTAKAEIRGRFNTGPIEHKVLATYDDARTHVVNGAQFVSLRSTDLSTGEITDRTAEFGPLFGIPGPRSTGGLKPKETGILLMDQMTWGKWIALAGWRNIRYEPNIQLAGAPSLGRFEKSLPSVGLLYRATPEISLYASASKGFEPNLGLYGFDGNPVSPEDAQQYEAGVKALLFHGRIAASLSVFSIDQKNVAVTDPEIIDPVCAGGTVCYVTVPGVKSKGFEVEVSGEILPRLEVRASYSYNDKEAENIERSGIFYAPHQGGLWATYRFSDSENGWWAGGGVQVRGARNDGTPEDAANPGQTRVDLSGGYDADRWSAVFGVKNVADERLYSVGSGTFGTGIAVQPREFYATLRYRFH